MTATKHYFLTLQHSIIQFNYSIRLIGRACGGKKTIIFKSVNVEFILLNALKASKCLPCGLYACTFKDKVLQTYQEASVGQEEHAKSNRHKRQHFGVDSVIPCLKLRWQGAQCIKICYSVALDWHMVCEICLDDSVCGVEHNREYSRKFVFKGEVTKEQRNGFSMVPSGGEI